MSRAFTRESDVEAASALLPERTISAHANLVTAEGLRKLQARVSSLEAARERARATDDAATLEGIARDLRYFTQRCATARVIEPAAEPDRARFGVCVTLRFVDAGTISYRIVGEDEADPAQGLISWTSPLGASLIGLALDDKVAVQGREAAIVKLAR